MKRATIATVFAVLAQSAGTRADGPPPWTGRASKIVARLTVPERGGIRKQTGTGFFVGFDNRTLYLVTASHVIWPDRALDSSPPSNVPGHEKVNLEVEVPGCAHLPAISDSAQASGREKLDLALVEIALSGLPDHVGAACKALLEHLHELPRHIVDPAADSLKKDAPVWIIGPGDTSEGLAARPLTFDRYSEEKNVLVFREGFTRGDSGSPVFSDRGHLVGMAIHDSGHSIGMDIPETGVATRFNLILARLAKAREPVPTNLAGSFSSLLFSDEYRGVPLSIDSAPDAPLRLPHPAPRGRVALTLHVDDTRAVTGIVDVGDADMDCDVAVSRWLARHKRAGLYTTIGLGIATGISLAMTWRFQNSFEQSPSRSSYDNVGLFNTITIGTGSAAVASLGATVIGYFSSETSGITCREGQR